MDRRVDGSGLVPCCRWCSLEFDDAWSPLSRSDHVKACMLRPRQSGSTVEPSNPDDGLDKRSDKGKGKGKGKLLDKSISLEMDADVDGGEEEEGGGEGDAVNIQWVKSTHRVKSSVPWPAIVVKDWKVS